MRIAIDGKHRAAPQTGVQRYSSEMVQRLVALDPQAYHVLAPAWADAARTATGTRRRLLRWCNNAWEQAWLPLAVRTDGYQLLYCPGNMAPALSRRTVLVLHDVIPLQHPEWFGRGFARWARFMFPRAARAARWVITDSHASRRAILSLFPFLGERLSVVYPGIGAQFRPVPQSALDGMRQRYRIGGPYLLFLGTLDPRKNLERTLEAWRQVASVEPDGELLIAGMTSELFRGSSSRSRALLGIPRVRWLGYVPDDDLPALLGGSQALVYPSLDEGFGFPPLEAMATGRPAVVSTAGSLPEVCGDAAVYVDPASETSIADGMRTVLAGSGTLAPIVARGLAQSARYTWDRAAAETHAIIQQVG